MKSEQTAVFTLMVDNEFGVLTRITALIRRAGWNIRSLAVAETQATETSRLTICIECRNNTLEHVLERLGKLACVREISVFSRENQAAQELALVRVRKDDLRRLDELCAREGYKTLHEGEHERVLAITCEPEHIGAAIRELRGLGITELARTGLIAMKISQNGGNDDENNGQ